MYGLGIGCTLLTPFYVCSLYYPTKKALLQGVLSGAFGAGAGIWTFVSGFLNNPDGELSRDLRFEPPGAKPFLWDIALNFPDSLRVLSICYLVITIAVLVTIPNIPQDDTSEKKADHGSGVIFD